VQVSEVLAPQLRRLGRAVVDGVLPPRCLACGTIVDEPDALCSPCWAGMTFFAPPWCAICGLPFPHPMGEEAVCADCARQKPSWDRARAVMRYDKHSRHLVLALKHGDRTHVARALGRWMGRAGVELLDGADIIVPVPLHWTRLFTRRSARHAGWAGSPPPDPIPRSARPGGAGAQRARRLCGPPRSRCQR